MASFNGIVDERIIPGGDEKRRSEMSRKSPSVRPIQETPEFPLLTLAIAGERW